MLAKFTELSNICADLMPDVTGISGEDNNVVYVRADGQMMYLEMKNDKVIVAATVSEATLDRLRLTEQSTSLVAIGEEMPICVEPCFLLAPREEMPIRVKRVRSGNFWILFEEDGYAYWHTRIMIRQIINAM